MKLIERFTRVADDTIRYQFTVDDPSTWTKPWSAEMPMKKTIGPIYSSTPVTKGITACTTRSLELGPKRREPPREGVEIKGEML